MTTKKYHPRPSISIQEETDYQGKRFWMWTVYTSDWVNQDVKRSGVSDTKEKLWRDIGRGVAEVLPYSAETYGLGF